MAGKHTIIPHLWFDRNAGDAVNFYISIFENSKITKISRYGDAGPGLKGSVMSIGFQLNGQEFAAIRLTRRIADHIADGPSAIRPTGTELDKAGIYN
jgi:predicted 3-demethylubiquinone-9 3-methyltransferase (glyoxalase superfamily)